MAGWDRWKRSGLAREYFGVTYDTTIGSEVVWSAVKTYIAGLPDQRGLWLAGPQGTGKTLLSHLVADAALDLGMTVHRFTVHGSMDLFRRRMDCLKLATECRDDRARSEYWYCEDVIRKTLGQTPLVLIDDLGKEHHTATRFAEDELERLIRARGDRQLPTVVTSNRSRGEIAKDYGDSFESYLHQTMVQVPVVGRDTRLS
jgi:DNA replication protein DnaC